MIYPDTISKEGQVLPGGVHETGLARLRLILKYLERILSNV